MNRYKATLRLVLFIAIALLVGTVFGIFMQRTLLKTKYIFDNQKDKIAWALSLIEKKYVDPVSRDSLAEVLLPILFNELDPHSAYLTAEQFAAMNEPLTGSFDGIGVVFNMLTDTVLVTNVVPGGPSFSAGVVAGDKIITVNDRVISGVKMNQDTVVSLLRGPRGSEAKLGIQRLGAEDLFHTTVTRGVIPIKSVEASFLIKPDIGYIHFTRFAATTYQEVMAAMKSLEIQGAKRVILDMRGNAGGYLDQAVYIANEFLPEGSKIVYTEGHAAPRMDQKADGRGAFQKIPLAVVIDEGSASASEILAGAIQDNDRGIVIGRRSFGKGLVQEQFTYKDGSIIRLTIARYYTPVGRSIQKSYALGHKEGDKDYQEELLRRYERGEFLNADSIQLDKSKRYYTPGGKAVYGGGGIMPDVFVPLDTVGATSYYARLEQKNLIFRYATQITESNRKEINRIGTFEEMDQFFSRRNLYYDFIAYADRAGVRPTEEEMSSSKELILGKLKGYIGRGTAMEDNAYYYYVFPADATLKKTAEELRKQK